MQSDSFPLILFLVSIGILLFGIIKLKINPFIVLLVVGVFTGLVGGLPITKVTKLLSDGFGQTMGNIGIMVALGILLGKVLADAGATEQIARLFLRSIGVRYSLLAICITGYIVCIPVFLTAAFIVFMPLLRDLAKNGKIPLGLLSSPPTLTKSAASPAWARWPAKLPATPKPNQLRASRGSTVIIHLP